MILASVITVIVVFLSRNARPRNAEKNFKRLQLLSSAALSLSHGGGDSQKRPFCKAICPVGLLLGWVSKIPGASVLGVKENCISCVKCTKGCNIRAITHDSKINVLNNQECIRCGECLSSCPKNAIWFARKNKDHNSKVQLTNTA